MDLPELVKTDRDREYQRWGQYIYQIVYNFLFLGKTHRQIDREILGFEKPNGFQSMGVLHYLGLSGEFRNIFAETTVTEAITIMRQSDKSDFSKIINILSCHDSLSDKKENINENKPLTQKDAVVKAMKELGGTATFDQLYKKIDFSVWKTKTPEASVRSIVQRSDLFYKIEPGLWGLTELKNKSLVTESKPNSIEEKTDFSKITIKLQGTLKSSKK